MFLLLLFPVAAHGASSPRGLGEPGWDETRCGRLTVSTGVSGGRGDRRVEDFRAALSPVGQPEAEAARLHAASLRTDGPAALDTLPELFAGGLLIAMERDRPSRCDIDHAFRRSAEEAASLPAGTKADQRWTALRIETGPDVYQVATLRLHAENGNDGVTRFSEEATGLSSAGDNPSGLPIAHASIEVSMPHDRLVSLANGQPLAADDVVTVKRMTLSGTDTRVEASGEVRPAARAGHLTVRAENMEGIKAALPVGDRNRAGAAFLIMRLAAKQEPDGTLAWDLVWNADGVTINGVSLPIHL